MRTGLKKAIFFNFFVTEQFYLYFFAAWFWFNRKSGPLSVVSVVVNEDIRFKWFQTRCMFSLQSLPFDNVFGTDRKSNLTSLKPFRPENLSKLQQILFETCVELFRPL